MARYIVLAVENDDEAEALVREIREYDTFTIPDAEGGLAMVPVELVAVVKKPTKFCACASRSRRAEGFTRGQKWGWWVHPTCMMPERAWGERYAAVIGSANNLLEQINET